MGIPGDQTPDTPGPQPFDWTILDSLIESLDILSRFCFHNVAKNILFGLKPIPTKISLLLPRKEKKMVHSRNT
jgi:hypothetical protein